MDANFQNKHKLLFQSLSSAEECVKGTLLDQKSQTNRNELENTFISPHNPTNNNDNDNNIPGKIRKYSGNTSLFKRPGAPIGACLRRRFHQPDYQKNPHKWKKYTLDDTDTSEQTNTAAAFAFLQEIEERKRLSIEQKSNMDDVDDNDNDNLQSNTERKPDNKMIKPIFNRSNRLKRLINNNTGSLSTASSLSSAAAAAGAAENNDNKPIYRGSKIVLPEYVIGAGSGSGRKVTKRVNKLAKIKPIPDDTSITNRNCKELKLDHLLQHEEDDEFDDDDDMDSVD